MGIIDNALTAVITNSAPTWDEFADKLAWHNDSEDNDLDSYPGSSWSDPGYEPTLEEEAEEGGYQAGLEGAGPCSSPADWPGAARMAYATGRQRGRRDLAEREEREQIDYEAWLEELAEDREAELERYAGSYWNTAEVIEAAGVIESRKASY